MITIKTNININRSASEVFAYISNFENNPLWQSGMKEAKFTTTGTVRIGSTYAQVASFLGRRIESKFEVIAYEPNRMVKATSTSGTFPITFTRIVEAKAGGCVVTAIIEGDASGIFKIAKPFLNWMVQKSVDGDYTNLKKILETSK